MLENKSPYFINPKYCPKILQENGIETTILTGFAGDKMMMVLNETKPGCTMKPHSHEHEQIGIVYAGKAILTIGGEERIVEEGDFYRIPANTPHTDTCLSDTPFVMLDIFYPIRDDFIEKLKGVVKE